MMAIKHYKRFNYVSIYSIEYLPNLKKQNFFVKNSHDSVS